MIHRSTWLWLGAYALYGLAHAAFVRAPGPGWAARPASPLAIPADAELLELQVLAGETRALATLRRSEQLQLWLLDWTRAGEWAEGAPLEALRLQQLQVAAAPEQARMLDDGSVCARIDDPAAGPLELRWSATSAELRPLPPETLWVRDDGQPLTRPLLDLALRERGVRVWPEPAIIAGDIAVVRVNASPDPQYDDWLRDDDLLLFSRNGQLLAHQDTTPLAWVAAHGRDSTVLFASNEAHFIEHVRCSVVEGSERTGTPVCETVWELGPHAGTGAAFVGVDHSPLHGRAAACIADALHLYAWRIAYDDPASFLGSAAIACTGAPVLVDDHRVALRSDAGWVMVEFELRGGWLREGGAG